MFAKVYFEILITSLKDEESNIVRTLECGPMRIVVDENICSSLLQVIWDEESVFTRPELGHISVELCTQKKSLVQMV